MSRPSASSRGANFTQDEDCQLARSWIRIAEDSVKGSGQKSDQFWARIEADFNLHSTGENRKRPIGIKAAKRAKHQMAQDARSQKALVESQLLRAQAMNLQAELSLMTVPTEGLNEAAQEYIALQQAAILAKVKRGKRDQHDNANDDIALSDSEEQ
ncbi:unnamed protein product, partial [Aphanomyces euteiches]